MHTNGFDEALSLPTEEAARIAVRTQQIIAHESGVTDTVDPLAGSYFIETLTDQVEQEAWKYIEKIDAMGGSVSAIEEGFIQNEIANSAYQYQTALENGEEVLVGVNRFEEEEGNAEEVFSVDDSIRQKQITKLKTLKKERDNQAVQGALQQLEEDAKNGTNLMPTILACVEAYATLGEISDVLRKVFGEY